MASVVDVADLRGAGAESQRKATDAKKYLPPQSDFYQQLSWAWRPVFTPNILMIQFAVVGCFMLAFGAAAISDAGSLVEYEKRYDDACSSYDGAECTVEMTITEEMKAPVYFYYKLDKYHQNHRRYVSSRDDYQIKGSTTRQMSSLESTCKYAIKQQGDSTDSNHAAGTLLPCGLITQSLFTDTYGLSFETAAGDYTVINVVDAPFGSENLLRETDLTWESDKDRFKNPDCFPDDCASDTLLLHQMQRFITPDSNGDTISDLWNLGITGVTNDHYKVWMRSAALANFRKIYGVINETIPAGSKLTVTIHNREDVSLFGGKKYLVVATTGWSGTKNDVMGQIFMVLAGLYIAAFAGYAGKHFTNPRAFGDPKLNLTK